MNNLFGITAFVRWRKVPKQFRRLKRRPLKRLCHNIAGPIKDHRSIGGYPVGATSEHVDHFEGIFARPRRHEFINRAAPRLRTGTLIATASRGDTV